MSTRISTSSGVFEESKTYDEIEVTDDMVKAGLLTYRNPHGSDYNRVASVYRAMERARRKRVWNI